MVDQYLYLCVGMMCGNAALEEGMKAGLHIHPGICFVLEKSEVHNVFC